jgi:type IV pilus assembly protein PilE
MRSRQSGVTLIELITVVVIVGILSAIAIPGYRSYVIRANRTDAKSLLMSVATQLEKCYTRYNDYRNPPCGVANSIASSNGTYIVTVTRPIVSATQPPAFSLSAAPQNAQAADAACSNLTLDDAGVRGTTGTHTVAECWGK